MKTVLIATVLAAVSTFSFAATTGTSTTISTTTSQYHGKTEGVTDYFKSDYANSVVDQGNYSEREDIREGVIKSQTLFAGSSVTNATDVNWDINGASFSAGSSITLFGESSHTVSKDKYLVYGSETKVVTDGGDYSQDYSWYEGSYTTRVHEDSQTSGVTVSEYAGWFG